MEEDKKKQVCIFCQQVVEEPVPTTCSSCNSSLPDKSYLVSPSPLSAIKDIRTVRQIIPNTGQVNEAKPPSAHQPAAGNGPRILHGPHDGPVIHDAETVIGEALAGEKTREWVAAETILGAGSEPFDGEETILDLEDEETRANSDENPGSLHAARTKLFDDEEPEADEVKRFHGARTKLFED